MTLLEVAKTVFVARQPIMDVRGRVKAYELLFRDGPTTSATITDDFVCTATVVERTLNSIGLERLADGKDLFLNCSSAFLQADLLDVLPARRFVLEVLESCELSKALGKRCAALRGLGFRIALDDVWTLTPEIVRFLPFVDIVKIDWPLVAAENLASLVSFFRRSGKRVIAEKIEQPCERTLAVGLGCDYLQGYYFARPQVLSGRSAIPSFGAMMHIIALLDGERPYGELAQAVGKMPILVEQLLRLANSSVQCRERNIAISSVSQALALAGSRRLMHWCCLLLYAHPDGLSLTEDPVVLLAERRATFMAHIASSMEPDPLALSRAAFLTGMLSLLHVVHGYDRSALLSELPVAVEIKEALTEGKGILGTLLHEVELLESGTASEVTKNIDALSLLHKSAGELLPRYY